MTDLALARRLLQLRRDGLRVCLATVVEAAGSTPRDVGAKMLLCGDGATFGTIGGGCGEAVVRSAALRMLASGQGPGLVAVDLTQGPGERDGDVCGGRMRIFVDPG
ncbi:MAG: hypothetical protein A2X36_01780 [Elusimicrobia bacterium GWA2_69_24]|nr:MAG: hypothetical protein A2X36_01780 [Elusimicrobia bacterium GWA2_69_24]HBL16873.1 sulfurylase small subunit [Elusimicrobiota bacterium]